MNEINESQIQSRLDQGQLVMHEVHIDEEGIVSDVYFATSKADALQFLNTMVEEY